MPTQSYALLSYQFSRVGDWRLFEVCSLCSISRNGCYWAPVEQEKLRLAGVPGASWISYFSLMLWISFLSFFEYSIARSSFEPPAIPMMLSRSNLLSFFSLSWQQAHLLEVLLDYCVPFLPWTFVVWNGRQCNGTSLLAWKYQNNLLETRRWQTTFVPRGRQELVLGVRYIGASNHRLASCLEIVLWNESPCFVVFVWCWWASSKKNVVSERSIISNHDYSTINSTKKFFHALTDTSSSPHERLWMTHLVLKK